MHQHQRFRLMRQILKHIVEINPFTATVCVAYLGTGAKPSAVALVHDLRTQGIGTAVLWENRSLKAQMKHADRINAEYTLILGEDEINNGTVTVRRMTDSTQGVVPISDIVDVIQGRNALEG